MPDAPDTETPPVDTAPAAVDTPAPPETQAPPEAEGGERPWDDPAVAEKVITSLRKENGDRRAALRDYEDVFGGLDDDDRGAMFEFVKAYKEDPASAGAIAKQWGEVLTPAERGDIAEATGAAITDAPLTEARFNQLMAEREQQQGVAAATAELQREARDLGYDPEGAEYVLLMQFAFKQTNGDLKKADELVKAMFQSHVDEFVNGKKNDANTSPIVPGVGTASTGEKPAPTEWADIRKAAMERLEHME